MKEGRKEGMKEGRKEGIIGRSITAQVGQGRYDQRSRLRIAIFSRCLRSLFSNFGSLLIPFLWINRRSPQVDLRNYKST